MVHHMKFSKFWRMYSLWNHVSLVFILLFNVLSNTRFSCLVGWSEHYTWSHMSFQQCFLHSFPVVLSPHFTRLHGSVFYLLWIGSWADFWYSLCKGSLLWHSVPPSLATSSLHLVPSAPSLHSGHPPGSTCITHFCLRASKSLFRQQEKQLKDLIVFLSLRNHWTLLPGSEVWKTLISHILSTFCAISCGQANPLQCFMGLQALFWGTNVFGIVKSSGWTDLFIIFEILLFFLGYMPCSEVCFV